MPKKNLPEENKTHHIHIRFNEAELVDAQAKADKHFQGKLSRLVRFCVKQFKE